MSLTPVDGPFESFAGEWRFEPLGDAGCRVELAVEYALSNRALDAAMGPCSATSETLVDRFVARADEVAGGGEAREARFRSPLRCPIARK